MTSTVIDAGVGAASTRTVARGRATTPGTDLAALRQLAAKAAAEITGVVGEVGVRAKLVRGAAVLRLRLPVRYPMPVWQVAAVSRNHVLRRLAERFDVPVRRLDIEVVTDARRSR